MTRQEEREQAALEAYYPCRPWGYIQEFIRGAEWADEHPKEGFVSIDKVVDWLRDNFHSYEIADTGYGHVESLNFMNTEVMIEDFLETIKK